MLSFSTPPQSLCILRLSAIGDICHALPVVRTLQTVWPQTRITWIIGKLEATLIGDVPGVEFIIFDKSAGRAAFKKLKQILNNRHFDVLLHMQASMRGNRISRLIKTPHRVGFDRGRARDFQWMFTNHTIAPKPRQHVLDGLFGFIETLGIATRDLHWEIPISDFDRCFAEGLLPGDQPTLMISPCSSARRRNWRNWMPDRYAAVADHAIEKLGLRVLLSGGPSEQESDYGQKITAAMRHTPINIIGQTSLKQLLALLKRATTLISPDSGPAHMATTVGTPVIGLYVTSNPLRTGPYLSQQWVVNRYPEALEEELGKSIDDVKWGQRVRSAEAMSRIEIADVTAMLDTLMNPDS